MKLHEALQLLILLHRKASVYSNSAVGDFGILGYNWRTGDRIFLPDFGVTRGVAIMTSKPVPILYFAYADDLDKKRMKLQA